MRLVLPGEPRSVFPTDGNRGVYQYVWPCGCRGTGLDDAALEVVCCAPHSGLIASATSSRTLKN
jgi:hypothetical protein